MGVGAGPLHVRCRRKKFTFAISSPDEFLVQTVAQKEKEMSTLVICIRNLAKHNQTSAVWINLPIIH